jgi:hypothetical protein
MMKQLFFILCINFINIFPARSPFRKINNIPTIIVKNENSNDSFIQKESHIEYYPFFQTYDAHYLAKHQLDKPFIEYRFNRRYFFSTMKLKEDLELLVKQVKRGTKKYSSFSIIKKKNFNFKLKCGLLVLKHKRIPIVVKLFIERPETLINPTWKGLDPTCFFYMAGGANRHFAGFTRIKNRQYVEKWVAAHPFWKNKVILPRKWFWHPKDPEQIMIEGINLLPKKKKKITIPGIYAIIADYFPFQTPLELKEIKHNIITA